MSWPRPCARANVVHRLRLEQAQHVRPHRADDVRLAGLAVGSQRRPVLAVLCTPVKPVACFAHRLTLQRTELVARLVALAGGASSMCSTAPAAAPGFGSECQERWEKRTAVKRPARRERGPRRHRQAPQSSLAAPAVANLHLSVHAGGRKAHAHFLTSVRPHSCRAQARQFGCQVADHRFRRLQTPWRDGTTHHQ